MRTYGTLPRLRAVAVGGLHAWVLALAALVLLGFSRVSAQQGPPAGGRTTPAAAGSRIHAPELAMPGSAPSPRAGTALPFGVGEEMTYKLHAKWKIFGGGGDASLRVEAIDTVRGFPAYRLVMRMKGGITLYRMDDVHRSWLDVDGLFSRRFEQKLNQTMYDRDRTYEFLVDQGRYVDPGNPADNGELASRRPLDDVSFIYHVRTLPLEVGKEYTEPRYYKSDGNPVTVRVLRTERIRVPAGEFDAIVIQPIIRREKSMFKEDSRAEIWLSNDERRLLLKLTARTTATITIELESYTEGREAVVGSGRGSR